MNAKEARILSDISLEKKFKDGISDAATNGLYEFGFQTSDDHRKEFINEEIFPKLRQLGFSVAVKTDTNGYVIFTVSWSNIRTTIEERESPPGLPAKQSRIVKTPEQEIEDLVSSNQSSSRWVLASIPYL